MAHSKQASEALANEEHEKLFNKCYISYSKNCTNNIMMPESRKKEIIAVLKDEESTHPLRYNFRRRFGVIQVGAVEHLYLLKDEPLFQQGDIINLEKIIRIVTEEELFIVLHETHRTLLHGRLVEIQNWRTVFKTVSSLH